MIKAIDLYQFFTLMPHIKPLKMLCVQLGSVDEQRMEGVKATSTEETGVDLAGQYDATALELATGLSTADMEALQSDSGPEVRADIAAKFTREFDRLAKGTVSELMADLLGLFSKDRDRLVRMRFADGIKTSPHLPTAIATRLARDEIDVAAPILRESPVLDDETIADIIKSLTEVYALAIAERRPLQEPLVDLLIEHKGTLRIAARLLENDQADLSEAALMNFREWGRCNGDVANRLSKRPDLPFAFVNESFMELAEKVRWRSLGERSMSKYEATLLQQCVDGRSRQRCSTKGSRFRHIYQDLRQEFEKGLLDTPMLLSFLRDQDIDRLECGFVVLTGLDLRWVRTLLYGSDRRGLIALCLKADFGAADYLAFRIALTLAELGTMRQQASQRYDEKLMKFARDQFEQMRAAPHQLKEWLPPDAR